MGLFQRYFPPFFYEIKEKNKKISKNFQKPLDFFLQMVYYIIVARADIAQQVERNLGKDEVPGSNPGISSRKTSQKRLAFCYINTCLRRFEALWSESEGPRFYFRLFCHITAQKTCRNALIYKGFSAFSSATSGAFFSIIRRAFNSPASRNFT